MVEYNPDNVKQANIRKEVELGDDVYDAVEYADSEWLENSAVEEKKYSIYYVEPVNTYDSDLELLFSCKDEILNNLKEKKFYEYKNSTITGVKVLVHPSNEGRVSLY